MGLSLGDEGGSFFGFVGNLLLGILEIPLLIILVFRWLLTNPENFG